MENDSNFGWGVAPDSKPHPRGKNDIYSCGKRQGWKWSQLVLWSLLHTKWTMPAILGGALTPTATLPQTRGKNDIYSCDHRQSWKWSQLVLWNLLHTKWTMPAILGGALTPTATLPGIKFLYLFKESQG